MHCSARYLARAKAEKPWPLFSICCLDNKKYWVGDHTWLIKSGNPGYLPGRPLLSGILTHEGEGLPLRNPISNAQQQDSEGASGYGGNWVIKSDPLYQVWPQATVKFILLISVFTNQTLLKQTGIGGWPYRWCPRPWPSCQTYPTAIVIWQPTFTGNIRKL